MEINLDKRIERRLQNDADRLSAIEQEFETLVLDTRVGRAQRSLVKEYDILTNDIKRYTIPVGARLSSSDGAITVGRFAGKRVLDTQRYLASGISGLMARDHSECLVPMSPDIFTKAMGCDVSGYYTQTPYTVVTDAGRFVTMMEHIAGVRG